MSQTKAQLIEGLNINTSAPADALVIDSSGQVVIGGTSPLDSDKQLTLTTTSTSGGLGILSPNNGRGDIFFGDAADDNVGQIKYSHVDDSLTIRTNAADRFVIASDGDVGIGTTSPSARLHVYQATGDDVGIRIQNNDGYAELEADADELNYNADSHVFNNQADSSEYMRINSSGKVGIGTTSPAGGLHVDAASGVDGPVFDSGGTANTNHALLVRDSSNNQLLRVNNNGNVGIGQSSPNALLEVNSGTAGNEVQRIEGSYSGSGSVVLSNWRRAGGAVAANLQYHDSSPIKMTLGTSTSHNFVLKTADTDRLTIDNSGNVGIGATSPAELLHVSATSPAILIEATDTSTGESKLQLGKTGNTNVGEIKYSHSNNSLSFRVNDGEKARIDSSGRLLVGTSSSVAFNGVPSAVQIQGSTNATTRMSIRRTANDSSAGVLVFGKSRSSAHAVLSNNDEIGKIEFYGADGTDTNQRAGMILSAVDGTPGTNDMPGRLVFFTTADGSGTPTERLRIDSSGNVGIGTASPGNKLTLASTANENVYLQVGNDDTTAFIGVRSDALTAIETNQATIFTTGSSYTERMRVTDGGELLIGTTSEFSSSSSSATGHRIEPEGTVSHYRNSGTVLYVGRQGNDGTIISIRQAGSEEGTISVSGSTVSYNGGHLARWSQLAGGAERTEILRGSVLSNLDEMCEWGEEDNEQLNRMQVSSVEGDVNVAGVFQAWDDDDDTYTNDFYCAMTGDFIIRIAQGTTVARGDLLMSAGDGTAKPQDDDIVRSKTIAKVTSTTVSTTYSDGSYCVPCVLMAC
ncbi:MAG: hypothetical protein DWQ49_03575 [Bacteroidetes bacterium]|nr:MAG: hypothetical protein DWQ49_03575 [Bacteroidota bacterium]